MVRRRVGGSGNAFFHDSRCSAEWIPILPKRCFRVRGTRDLETRKHFLSVSGLSCMMSICGQGSPAGGMGLASRFSFGRKTSIFSAGTLPFCHLRRLSTGLRQALSSPEPPQRQNSLLPLNLRLDSSLAYDQAGCTFRPVC